MNIRYKRN